MNVDIRLRALSGDRQEIRIPILPESITAKYGEGQFIEYDIMGRGKVAIPSGVGLSSISFESELPGEYRTDRSMIRGDFKKPRYYQDLFNRWKNAGTPLRIIVTGFPINMQVNISEFTTKPSGFMGDVPYEISFVESGGIIVTQTQVRKTTTSSKRKIVGITSYTVKKGDNLWMISQRVLGTGTRWKELYNLNKNIIEQTARKYGKSSSNNGWWIYPGTKLKIPKLE